MRVVFYLVFWTRALASSAASMACLLVFLLTCVEMAHRSPEGDFQASSRSGNEHLVPPPLSPSASSGSPLLASLHKAEGYSKQVPSPRMISKHSMRSGRFDSLIEERIRRSSEAVRAAKFCDFRTFEDLIKDGSDVFALDGNGELPLAWAVRSNCSEIANKLLNLGADFEQPEGNGLSPLDWAKKERNFEMITLFHEDTYSGTL